MRLATLQFLLEVYPLVAGLVSVLLAQILKIVYYYIKEGSLNPKSLISTGGMPSSHAAMVTGLSMAVGLQEGWTSTLFCVCVIFSLVVLYDAAGIRRAAGKQATVLNQVIEDVLQKGEFKPEKLSEFLGHTPLEVVVGSLLGIGIAFSLYY